MNASCQQENGKFETDCFQVLSPDIFKLRNVMLLVDWLQVNVFLYYSLNTLKNDILFMFTWLYQFPLMT